jgi:glycolate oxidase FAD binding subunit
MRRVRQAFDPTGRLNPGKLIPDGINGEELEPLAVSQYTSSDRVIDYPAADMTITVEAGMTIAELNRQLAAQRQWLPVDVAWPDRTTVGGAIAVNAAGPRRYAYGTMRDYLLGFTAVDGSGMTFSGGGRVVKNAAGYNMCRLMAGSLGTLGVITQATLMVRPLPEAVALLACEVPDFDLAEKLLADLVHSPVRPVAVELFAGRAHENNPLFGPISEGNVARLCISFEGLAEEVGWMLDELRQQWTSLGMTSQVLTPNLVTDGFWRWIVELPADVRLSVLPSKLIETITEILRTAPDCAIQAHAGDGMIHISGIENNIAENSRGLTAPGELAATPRGLLAHGYCAPDDVSIVGNSPELRIMQAIKERFDPKNALVPYCTPHAPREATSSRGA